MSNKKNHSQPSGKMEPKSHRMRNGSENKAKKSQKGRMETKVPVVVEQCQLET